MSFLQVSCQQTSLLHGFNCTVTVPCCPLLSWTDPFLAEPFLFCFQSLLPAEIAGFPLHCHQSAGAQHQPNRGICSHSCSYLRLPTLYSETQHFSSSVIHVSDFPLQNKTTSNSLVLRLSLHLQESCAASFLLSRAFSPVFFPAPFRASAAFSLQRDQRGWLLNDSWFCASFPSFDSSSVQLNRTICASAFHNADLPGAHKPPTKILAQH